ncbi:MAG TPA: Uma2 family endonuclease [Bryobacteraceae bacterium]|jgi:Uma2 family endonuclease|nr:Uma2 family endonuclease [Bryobacteraceae bacterium]
MSTSTRLINYEDSLTMPENRFEEIVHGESRIMPPPIKKHVYLTEKLFEILKAQINSSEYYVTLAGAGLGIERVPLTYRIPDLMVFGTEALRRDRTETAESDPYIWAVPELIVECLSPSNRKGSIQELLADYGRVAVPEVWLLDPAPSQFTSYRYESGELRQWLAAESGLVTPVGLPNVAVDLAALWAAFDGVGL